MSLAAIVSALFDAGATREMIVAAVSAYDQGSQQVRVHRRNDPDDQVWVYVIEVEHPGDTLVKVGISKHPHLRLATLEKERGYNLYLTHTEGPFSRTTARAVEAKAHGMLSSQREKGEWFLCGAERAVDVVQACAAAGVQ